MVGQLQVIVTQNSKGGHHDVFVSITGLVDLKLDSYYFALAVEPEINIQAIRSAIAQLLSYWKTVIEDSTMGQTRYLPIDFSDEYTGCLKVCDQGDTLSVTYGFSNREGYGVNPLNPGDYAQSIRDFQQDSNDEIEIDKNNFIRSIESQVEKLNRVS